MIGSRPFYISASLLLWSAFVAPARAQLTAPAFTLAMGAGNTFGGVGLRGEAHFLRGHVSVLAGAGVFPSPGANPAIGALGLRYHVGSSQHSVYAGISWTYVWL